MTSDTMNVRTLSTFALAAAVSVAGSVALGRALYTDPSNDSAPIQAAALVGLASVAGASLLCAGAAATDSQ